MKLEATFFRSKVARRILVLFVCCALVPITAVAILSFTRVTKQLNEQSHRRLRQGAKAMGMSIYERLLFLESDMEIMASSLHNGLRTNMKAGVESLDKRLEQRFKALSLFGKGGHSPLIGRIENPPELTPAEIDHMTIGRTLVSTQNRGLLSRIFMMRQVAPEAGFVLGEIDTTYLYGIGHYGGVPPMTELMVVDHSNNLLVSSLPMPEAFFEQINNKLNDSVWPHFEWKQGGDEYLTSYWAIPLKFQFFVPKWTVMLSQSKADVLAPMADFKKTFPLIVLMSLWVVLLLSLIHIRRSLVPLEKLKDGTQQIAARNFDSRVQVTSGDEFEELASSFNAMSGQLGRQFKALRTIGEIGRAILSALEAEKIVETVLTGMPEVFSCEAVGVTLIDPKETSLARTYVRKGNPGSQKPVGATRLTPEEVRALQDNPEHFFIHGYKDIPTYIAPLANEDIRSFLVLPVFLKERLSAIITLGYVEAPAPSVDETALSPTQFDQDIDQARQLADQMAVALSNAHLVEELDRLNWGTLTALARAVDAKSPWTAGHSERVTELALKIGQILGLSPKDLDVLGRAALLHDTGKIGVPVTILDKPGRLSEEEFRIIREHPGVGARILEPISAYADALPIVLQHHERLDGRGYPNGLGGEDICLGARILAVCDAFDAMVSDRPYRSGWDQKRVLEHIKQEAGKQFDPKVVDALLTALEAPPG